MTDVFDNFSFLLIVRDSFFVSVRNEPWIRIQKSVIFVCKGRATYLIGFQILDILRLNSGIRNRYNFFLWAIFLFQKIGNESVNHADSGDIYFIYKIRGIHLISCQPTQFQNLSEVFKIEFPGNWTKNCISPKSAWFP